MEKNSTYKTKKEEGLKRRLVGIEVTGRGIPRHGYKVLSEDEEEIGCITSGTHSPSLKKKLRTCSSISRTCGGWDKTKS
ncbi:hypothetical protein GCM10020331_002400 [Ectobacillus funiculus]